jgi:hypothetical protein
LAHTVLQQSSGFRQLPPGSMQAQPPASGLQAPAQHSVDVPQVWPVPWQQTPLVHTPAQQLALVPQLWP